MAIRTPIPAFVAWHFVYNLTRGPKWSAGPLLVPKHKSLAEFAPASANKRETLWDGIHFCPIILLTERTIVARLIAPLYPKGQSSDIRTLLLSKRKQCFRLEKEEGNKRVEFPRQGEQIFF